MPRCRCRRCKRANATAAPAGLYTFGIGLAASITSATQLKVELLDTLKNKPPSAAVKKNDVAVLVSFVYKID